MTGPFARLFRFVAAVSLLTCLAPITARAEHCGEIILFSRVTVVDPTTGEPVTNPATGAPVRNPTYDSKSVGCDVDPSDESLDTRVIYPGSNSFSVRYGADERPTSGRLVFAGKTANLTFTRVELTGGGNYVYDSQAVYFDPALSIDGGSASIAVCFGANCEFAAYRTLG